MRMRWAGHVVRIGRIGMHTGYWRGSQRERDHCEDQDVGRWILLRLILEGLEWDSIDWIDLAQDWICGGLL
jgi:hypothetical protein